MSKLAKANPLIIKSDITKEQADEALSTYLGRITGTGKAAMRDAMLGGMQNNPGAGPAYWKCCRAMFKDSERWWKKDGGGGPAT